MNAKLIWPTDNIVDENEETGTYTLAQTVPRASEKLIIFQRYPVPMQLKVNQRVYPREVDFNELNERVISEGKKTELKRCHYYRLQLRATFALLSTNLDKQEWMTFVYTISPAGFALRKGCESCTIQKDQDTITLTVTVKPG